jgi:hypothetical protein
MRALERRSRAFGDSDADTLQSMHNLGCSVMKTNDLASALGLLQRASQERARVLGPDDPSTLASMSAYASALSESDRAGEAEPVLADVLGRCRRVLGDTHPGTLATASQYAKTLLRLHRANEAQQVCEQSLRRARDALGEDAVIVLQLCSLRGSILMQLDQPSEAARVLSDLLSRMRRHFGTDHANTLIVQGMLGAAWNGAGEFDRSEPLLAEAARRAESVKPPPADWSSILTEHATALRQARRFDPALAALLRAREVLQADTGNGHRMQRVLEALVETCELAGKPEDARNWRAQLQALPPSVAPATRPSNTPF